MSELKPVTHWFIHMPATRLPPGEAREMLGRHLDKLFPHLDFTLVSNHTLKPNAGTTIIPHIGTVGGGPYADMREIPDPETGAEILDVIEDYVAGLK